MLAMELLPTHPDIVAAWVFYKDRPAVFVTPHSPSFDCNPPMNIVPLALTKQKILDPIKHLHTILDIPLSEKGNSPYSERWPKFLSPHQDLVVATHRYKKIAQRLIKTQESPPEGIQPSFPVSQGHFHRLREKTVMFPSFDTPGGFGIPELAPNPYISFESTWTQLVKLVASIALTKEGAEALETSDPASIRDKSLYALYCNVATLTCTANGWKNLWQPDPPDCDSLALNAMLLGTRNDCEDQAATAISTFLAASNGLIELPAHPKRPLDKIAKNLAIFLRLYAAGAYLVMGFAEAAVSTAKAAPPPSTNPADVEVKMIYDKRSPPQGHAWAVVAFKHPKNGRVSSYIAECTLPYHIHTSLDVYAKYIRRDPHPTITSDNFFPPPMPINPARYISVAAQFTASKAEWVVSTENKKAGVSIHDYLNGSFTKKPMAQKRPQPDTFAFVPFATDETLTGIQLPARLGYKAPTELPDDHTIVYDVCAVPLHELNTNGTIYSKAVVIGSCQFPLCTICLIKFP